MQCQTPAPTAGPFTMAITGFSIRCRHSMNRCARLKLRRMSSTLSDAHAPGSLPLGRASQVASGAKSLPCPGDNQHAYGVFGFDVFQGPRPVRPWSGRSERCACPDGPVSACRCGFPGFFPGLCAGNRAWQPSVRVLWAEGDYSIGAPIGYYPRAAKTPTNARRFARPLSVSTPSPLRYDIGTTDPG